MKGAHTLREGGLLIYISSQGILNSPKNEPIRKALMQENNLVSVIRLPNNLFTEYAGTEVGSDLIILQKNTAKQKLSEAEELFCQSKLTQYETPGNSIFQDNTRIVHTDWKLDTDPYGQPALIYKHNNGVTGIAKDLKQMLSEDFGKYLDLNLYKGERNDFSVNLLQKPQSIPTPVFHQESPQELKQLSIFDLFESIDEHVSVLAPPKKITKTKIQHNNKSSRVIGRQTNLFSVTTQQTYKPPITEITANVSPSTNSKKEEVIGDLFSEINRNGQTENSIISTTIPEPAKYGGELQSFHRNDCLVMDKGWVGYLKDVNTEINSAIFHPLQLPLPQKVRAEAYIDVRDVYQELYYKETTFQTEHKEERDNLNRLYDAFVKSMATSIMPIISNSLKQIVLVKKCLIWSV